MARIPEAELERLKAEVSVQRLVSERVPLDETPDALKRLQTPGSLVRIISRPWQ